MANYTAVSNPLPLTMGENTTVRPIFKVAPPNPSPTPTPSPSPAVDAPRTTTFVTTLIANPSAGGTVGGTSPTTPATSTVITSKLGEVTSFSAQENTGYDFAGWYLNGSLWSTNRSPAIITDRNQTYEARFTAKPPAPVECTCYFVAPTVPNAPFEVAYRTCAGEDVVQTFETFTNICSANIPQARRNAQVPQNLNTNCTRTGTCSPPPAPSATPSPSATPAPTATPAPSVTPAVTPGASVPVPSPTPFPSPTPSPIPSPPAVNWKNCVSGAVVDGYPPSSYRQSIYDELGTVCWEPVGLGFNPPLNDVMFEYRRGSLVFPSKKEFTATNASRTAKYEVTVVLDNNKFIVEPAYPLVILPQTTATLSIRLNPSNINQFGDGDTNFSMRVTTKEVE